MANDKKIITFKLRLVEQISLDSHARELGLSRSEFCRLAVQEKLSGAREIARERQQGSDTNKILSVLNSLNNNILSVRDMLDEDAKIMGGFRVIYRGIVMTNLNKVNELYRLFPDEEVWEKLKKFGVNHV